MNNPTYAKTRRDRLRAAGLCINGDRHGKATHGVLCARCRIVHNRGLLAAQVAEFETVSA